MNLTLSLGDLELFQMIPNTDEKGGRSQSFRACEREIIRRR